MQFSTLVTLTLATLVLGNNNPPITQCQTITSTIEPLGNFSTCTVLACLEVKSITQKCGCPTIPTISVTRTACPTSCGSTSYITAIEDCFPTSPPTSASTTISNPVTTTPNLSSTTTSSQPPDTTRPPSSSSLTSSSTTNPPPPPQSSTTNPPHQPPPTTPPPPPPPQNPYTNTTKTLTTTEHTTTTLTTCPVEHTCTGQTTTVTSTEPCPTSTCVCVLPSVTFITTVLPQISQSQESQQTTVPAVTGTATTLAGNTPPTPRPSPTFVEANVAGRFGFEVGLGLIGALFVAVAGFL